MNQLQSNALPDTPEALGKAIRRIAKRAADITIEARKSGDNRFITITLEKPSQPSQPSPGASTADSEEPREKRKRSLTEEEVQEAQRLKATGMTMTEARREILGDEA
jgi:hypothetical protein